MARWTGFDTYSSVAGNPGGGGKTIPTSCNPNPTLNNLAKYTAVHYGSVSPSVKFFGRYFFSTSGGGLYVPSSETAALSAAGLNFLIPISTPSGSRESTSGTTGQNYGIADANATLSNIMAAINYGQVGVPPTQPGEAAPKIYVYLDIEPGVALTADYWRGWAQTIFYASYSSTANCPLPNTPVGAPFWPCAYVNPNSVASTMQVLNAFPNTSEFCYGLWTQQTNYGTCASCTDSPPPAWSSAVGYGVLTTHFYQHSINGQCNSLIPGDPNNLDCEQNCRPWVDNNQSSPNFEMMYYILQVC